MARDQNRDQNIVILTGEGSLPRAGWVLFAAPGGLWSNFKIEDVATLEAFVRDPVRVHEFYNLRRSWHIQARPNAANLARERVAAKPLSTKIRSSRIFL